MPAAYRFIQTLPEHKVISYSEIIRVAPRLIRPLSIERIMSFFILKKEW